MLNIKLTVYKKNTDNLNRNNSLTSSFSLEACCKSDLALTSTLSLLSSFSLYTLKLDLISVISAVSRPCMWVNSASRFALRSKSVSYRWVISLSLSLSLSTSIIIQHLSVSTVWWVYLSTLPVFLKSKKTTTGYWVNFQK